jgi:uroporphyrinogen decarboxylase
MVDSAMTPRERSLRALTGGNPDVIPVQMDNFLVCAELSGKRYDEVFRDARLLADSQWKAWEVFGHDIIDVETGIATLAEACGCTVEYPPKAAPWVKSCIFEDLEPREIRARLTTMDIPVPSESRPLRIMMDATAMLASRAGERFLVKAEADQGPFNLAAQLRGMDRFLLDLADGQDYISPLLDFTTRVCEAYARALCESGADIVVIGDSFAGPDVVSPRIYETFAFSSERRLYNGISDIESRKSLHICGNADRILDLMIRTGADILEIDEKTDLRSASRMAKGKVCLLGAVSPGIIRNGTPEDVRSEVRRVIDSMNGNRRFILSPGCSLAGDSPVENVCAFVEAGRRYSPYS